MSFFKLLHQDKNSHARLGRIETDHGIIETPIFMPVGTQATVKTLDQTDVENIDAAIILGNTYHLHLRPGEDVIAKAGGLHKFMNCPKPILTDSGGFQVFSLGLQKRPSPLPPPSEEGEIVSPPLPERGSGGEGVSTVKRGLEGVHRLVSIDEDGVTFKSHLDGSKHRFTPEISIEIQHKIGADIIMAFDECTPDDADLEYTKQALNRTHAWAKRSLEAHHKNTSYHGYRQFLFGIIQGAQHRKLRENSARFISSLDFDGIAIGGESIGYNMQATAEIMDWVYPLIPEDKPHYTMGLGLNPLDLLLAVEHGADMFDCVAPTRLARHGMLYIKDPTKKHRLNITNAIYTTDFEPIDRWCDCSTCRGYSRAYLHHLFAADEMTGQRLASIHNLRFMLKLMEETRMAIAGNQFTSFKSSWNS